MANIPIEKKSDSSSILPWILGLIVLVGLVWLVTSMFSRDRTAETTATAVPADTRVADTQTTPGPATQPATPPTAAGGLITDPARLVGAADGRDLIGREVRFTNMRVEVPYSDSLFYATHEAGPPDRRFFVALGSPQRFGPTGASTLQVGQMVTVEGVIQEPRAADLARWDVAPAERDRLTRLMDYYIQARQVSR